MSESRDSAMSRREGSGQHLLSPRRRRFNNFKAVIEDIELHFLHHRSARQDAVPIILCHGWPGSFLEFLHVIPLLTEPQDATAPAFHVVVPSMPGYAFSSPPKTSKWQMNDTARIFDKLMRGLGYSTYFAQGGDWGSVCARLLGSLHKEHCKGENARALTPPLPLSLSCSLALPFQVFT